MKPELKLGRRCIAWNDEDLTEQGVYIYDDGDSEVNHVVWLDGGAGIGHFDHVKTDLTAEPMNGDEVEYGYEGEHFEYHGTGILCGEYIDPQGTKSFAIVTGKGELRLCKHVRFPQQSKRERVKEAIRSWQESSKVPMYDDLADQIDKIYTEE